MQLQPERGCSSRVVTDDFVSLLNHPKEMKSNSETLILTTHVNGVPKSKKLFLPSPKVASTQMATLLGDKIPFQLAWLSFLLK